MPLHITEALVSSEQNINWVLDQRASEREKMFSIAPVDKHLAETLDSEGEMMPRLLRIVHTPSQKWVISNW